MRIRKKNNLFPLVIVLGSLGVIAGSIFAFSVFFSADDGIPRKAYLDSTDETRAEVKLSGEEIWNEVIKVYLQEGDTVRSKNSTATKLTFFDNTVVYLDKNTNILLQEVREYNDNSTLVNLELEQGRAWVSVDRKLNPNSKVVITSPMTKLSAETSHAEFSFSQGQIVVISGDSVKVSVASDASASVFSRDIGVGQMISFANENFDQIQKGFEGPMTTMITDKFRESDWYLIHKENKIVVDDSTTDENADNSENGDENTDTSDTESTDTENSDIVKITKPSDNSTYTSDSTEITIEGTASSDVDKIVVDGWQLQQYTKGSSKWSYKISKTFDNEGKPGETKTYPVKVYNEDGELIGSDSIDITFNYTETEEETTTEDSTDTESVVDNADFQITKPSTEDTYQTSDDEILLAGTAPSNTAKVTVSDYQLQAYQAGSTSWSYKIKDGFGNRPEAGSSMTYVVKAYDANDKLIGLDSITIEITGDTTSADTTEETTSTTTEEATTTEDTSVPTENTPEETTSTTEE